ncbi:MAG: hypothetical protein M3R45_04875 [Pseudomonadota bacterium]|nr:hypothetical protein [Pseudomonadota bacterium]
MKAPISAPSGTAVSRFKERLRYPWSSAGNETASSPKTLLPAIRPERPVRFPASIAEFLLVFRLRARRPSTLSADILERAVRVVFVTCQHWFGGSDLHQHGAPRRHE